MKPPLASGSCCGGGAAAAPLPTPNSCCGGGLPPDRTWLKLGIAAVVAGQGMVFGLAVNMAPPPFHSTTYWILHGGLAFSALAVAAILGPRLVRESVAAARQKRLTVEALFLASIVGALIGSLLATFRGTGAVYYEVIAVVLAVYTIGKRLGDQSRQQVQAAVEELRTQFDRAQREDAHGGTSWVAVSELQAGDRVRVEPGAPIPVDGRVVEGEADVLETSLTGEPLPVFRQQGDPILAGSQSVDGRLVIAVDGPQDHREVDHLLRAVEEARSRPSRLQEKADHLTRGFLPFVLVVSLSTFFGWWLFSEVGWDRALFNSMAVLLVACPCALGLATPIAVWGGLYRLTREGLVCRSGEMLDRLTRTHHVFFDKTGTLSEPGLKVDGDPHLEPGVDPAGVARLVALAENGVGHPVGRALYQWARDQSPSESKEKLRVRRQRLFPGRGVEAVLQCGDAPPLRVRLGERTWATESSPEPEARSARTKTIWLAVDGQVRARFSLAESLRPAVVGLFGRLQSLGVHSSILSGDPDPRWPEVEGVSVTGGLSSLEKAERVKASRERGEWPIFVGDGMNDVMAMIEGEGSIAMHEGSELTRHHAEAVLSGGRLEQLAEGIEMSRRIHQKLQGNMVFAACYNVVGMSLAAAGILHPVVAALLMVVSSLLVSFRALRSVEKDARLPG